MVKYGKKRQILLELYAQGYDHKTALDYIKSPEGTQKYGEIKINRSYSYATYKKYKEGTLQPVTGEPTLTVSEGKKEPPKPPLQIQVTGEPTPPQQLQFITTPTGVIQQPTAQLITQEHMGWLWKSVATNYPQKYRWDDKASEFLGAVWFTIVNKWIQASSENWLLGFAVLCTIIVVLRPTILTLKEYMEKRKIGGKTKRQKQKEKESEKK